MAFIDTNLAGCLFAGLGLLCYKYFSDPNNTTIYSALKFLEPTNITSADFYRCIQQPNPCANFPNIKLVYTLPENEIVPVMYKLSTFGCFDEGKLFAEAVEVAFEAKDEETLITLINRAAAQSRHKSIIKTLFYNCAVSKLYKSVIFILNHYPLLEYEGKNIVNLAAVLDDPILLDLAPQDHCYLHLRDKEGNFPTKYVHSIEIYFRFISRCNFEHQRSPYQREFEANIDYFRKTYQIGFSTHISDRVALLFSDKSLIKSEFRLNLNVSRQKILKHSYKQLNTHLGTWGEADDNIEGSATDWFSSLMETFFKANPSGNPDSFTAPLFEPVSPDSKIYQPTGLYDASVYKFAGSIVDAALFKGIPTRVEFIPSLYRVLLGIEPYRVEDLKIQSPSVYDHLKSIRTSFINNSSNSLYDFKSLSEVDNYIERNSAALLYNNHFEFLEAFAEGFRSKLPHTVSKYLDLVDLRNVLKGQDTVSTQEFKENIEFSFKITTPSKSNELFLGIIDQLSQEERFELIRFITGRNGLPCGGLAKLPDKLHVEFDAMSRGNLPDSETFSSNLDLPTFRTLDELKDLLLQAINKRFNNA